jgi:ABC-2 type transport system permease protein
VSHRRGALALARLALRRDRWRLTIWLIAIVVLVSSQAAGIKNLYPEPADLAAAAELVGDNAAFIAMAGPPLALDTLGGRVTFEISAFAMVLAALMNLFLVSRHVRAEEESGRAELVRSTVVGRHAAVTAALVVALVTDLVLGGAIWLGLVGAGLDAAGSAALALGIGGVGLLFAGVGAVTSQLTTTSRAASGLAGAGLGASFVVRAIGDIGSGTVSWFSPLGWGQALRPFAGERWWVAGLIAVATVALGGLAFVVNSHRDVGSGVLQPRLGPLRASSALTSPLGLAVRLQRGALVAWSVGVFLGGVAYGSIGGDVEDLVADSEAMAEIMAQGGGDIVDSFLATTSLVLALIGAGFAVQAVLRLRSEERTGRAEVVLSTAVSRARWAGSHLAVIAVGTAIVLGAGGLGTGVTFAAIEGDAGQAPRLVGAVLVHVPAVLLLVAMAAALYGIAAAATPVIWAVLGGCFVVGLFGQVLALPGWAVDLSPFQHSPSLPAGDLTLAPLLVLLVIAAALTAVGRAGLRRRDIDATR